MEQALSKLLSERAASGAHARQPGKACSDQGKRVRIAADQ